MKPIDPQSAVETIWRIAPLYAKAKARRIYLEEYRKSLKALLMKASKAKTSAAQEVEAYSDPTYMQHLIAIQIAVEEEETLRWQLISAQTAVDVWRSTEASNRAIDRAAA